MNRANINRELRGPLLVLALVIPVLAFTGWTLHEDIARAGHYSQALRAAQIARARVLRYQLDEETGIRGYSATLDPLYLEPLRKAVVSMDVAFSELRSDLVPLALSTDLNSVVDREQQENKLWLKTIATPLTAIKMRTPTMLELHRRGKQLVDTFRNDDQRLITALNDAGSIADERVEQTVSNTLLYVIVSLISITAGAGVLGFLQARTSRRAFESQLLYQNEKRIADLLQEAFLNTTLPNSPNVGLHATYIPAMLEAQVGGDWYDAFELPDKRILFSIGDVAGHGIEAAVIMNRARQCILAAALHEDDPAKVLERANEAIYVQHARMVTAICGYIDPTTLEISYATAGHPPPVLARPGQPSIFLPHEGIPLGVLPDATYRTFVTYAFNGAVMVLYTDGVIEHKRNVFEGEEELLEASRLAVLTDNPAISIKSRIFATNTPSDDVAILTVTFKQSDTSSGITSIGALHFNRLEIENSAESGQRRIEDFDGEADVSNRAPAKIQSLILHRASVPTHVG